jgi:hypothetical protein
MSEIQLEFDVMNVNARGNAQRACRFASLAYDSEQEVELQLKMHGPGNVVSGFVKSGLVSCLIVRSDKVTVLAFSGTVGWRQWLNNLNLWPKPTVQGRIHSGFLNTIQRSGPILYYLIWPDILDKKNIVITGHSRGGALALVFASFLVTQGYRPHSVWTFGTPSVGDRDFYSTLDGVSIEQFVNYGDPIPRFPVNFGIRAKILESFVNNIQILYTPIAIIINVVVYLRMRLKGLWRRKARDRNKSLMSE